MHSSTLSSLSPVGLYIKKWCQIDLVLNAATQGGICPLPMGLTMKNAKSNCINYNDQQPLWSQTHNLIYIVKFNELVHPHLYFFLLLPIQSTESQLSDIKL